MQFAGLDGLRGPIQVFGLVMDAWWFDQSQSRQDAVRELLTHVHQAQDARAPLIICGDFNADPDSDEIRILTSRTAAPAPGLSFYDAWEMAGPPGPGHTWSNDNPWAVQLLWPSRRIDYIFSANPRTGGAGHPRHTALLGTVPSTAPIPRTAAASSQTSATEHGVVGGQQGPSYAAPKLRRATVSPLRHPRHSMIGPGDRRA